MIRDVWDDLKANWPIYAALAVCVEIIAWNWR